MSDVRVVSEQRTYTADAPHSFFRDQMDAIALLDRGALARLDRHTIEVNHEIERGTPEGQRALTERLTELRRQNPETSVSRLEAEARAATSTTITGFTTPQWIISKYAIFRNTQRTFADQCTKLPLPDVGLTVHSPRLTAAASAGAQVEGSSLSTIELDPTGVDSSENLQTIGGQVISSQQLLDRSRNQPDGPAFDVVLYDQLRDEYDKALNTYALSRAINLGGSVAGAGSFGAGGIIASFYKDIASAREQMTDLAGTRVQATHVFTTPDLYGNITQQLDSSQRPIIQPTLNPGVPPGAVGDEDGSDDQKRWAQFTGTTVPGLLFWFVDNGLPAYSSSKTPIIVSRPDKILLWEGEPVMRAYPETIGNQLQVCVQYYGYTACIPRFPNATVQITGAAYTTALV